MSSLSSTISTGISPAYTPVSTPTVATPPTGAGAAPSSPPKLGAGAMAARLIQPGNGEARTQATSSADQAKSFFKTAGKVLAGIILAPIALGVGVAAVVALFTARVAVGAVTILPTLINKYGLERYSDHKFEVANRGMLAQLRTPIQGSITGNADVMTRLEAHVKSEKTPISPTELRQLVATGERLAAGLAARANSGSSESLAPGGSPLTLELGGNQVDVPSSQHTTRALAWYMMAAAAGQDSARAETRSASSASDMVSSGAIRMKDPGNQIHGFLAAAPTAAARMSTHFAEVVDHGNKHKALGFIPTGKPAQRGIEDFRNRLPGAGGTMLFDKLKAADGSKELFVKFESVGCPPFFSKEPHQGYGQGLARFFSALDRNASHATDFVTSRFAQKEGPGVRQEHVYKGTLEKSVHAPFARLIDRSIQAGVVDTSAKAVGSSVHKFGMPFVMAALDEMEAHAKTLGKHNMSAEIQLVREEIVAAVGNLGAQSDRHGVERRGAEVHISMNPADNR